MTALEFVDFITDSLRAKIYYVLVKETEMRSVYAYFTSEHYVLDANLTRLKNECSIIIDLALKSGIANQFSKGLFKQFTTSLNFKHQVLSSVVKEYILNLKEIKEELFDNDPFKLNTKNGIYCYITGEIRKQTKEDYFFNITTANFIPGYNERPEIFINWIKNQITEQNITVWGNSELDIDSKVENFLEILGYLFTGCTYQKYIFFLLGKSNTSKSTFLEFLGYLLGSYYGILPIKGLMYKRTGDPNVRPELVDQRKKRLLISSEPDPHDVLDASIFKILTGNDGASFKKSHSDNIYYHPKCKIVVSSNYLPKVSNTTDDSQLSRFVVMEFMNPIPNDKQDLNFLNKLKEETTANQIFTFILSYSMKYAKNYFEKKMPIHNEFKQDFAKYLLQQKDPISMFWKDKIIVSSIQSSFYKWKSRDLYLYFLEYLRLLKYEEEVTQMKFFKRFSEIAEQHEFVHKTTISYTKEACYSGIMIKGVDFLTHGLTSFSGEIKSKYTFDE
ncbi:hypothetical protein EW093_01045 [Thiospirochaeta perfilievii]|uniref:SF3 helicase domain-containing protein n=1 Tax=Thiospirochaeta perfilievii TaxID=252967 RepID=A0A5C1Q8X5_9SPIO|nr:hypothetical protein [Thiospirochaeta perfilievii]QEN03349.1 hypothetical protein EW093_01045 [Thiospirochaeta perfilievii]